MPELLPGKKAPLSVAQAEADALAKLNAAGPDPALEETDDGEEIVLESELLEGAPAGATGAVDTARGNGNQPPAAGLDQPAAPANDGGPPPAPSAAAPADDLWSDTEDVTYEDADTGEKYVVRSPKKYASKVKDGYQRRSFMDRKLSVYGQNRAWLDPLVENGSFTKLAPILQRVFNEKDLQDTMAEMLNRKQAGLPLKFLDAIAAEAAAAGAAPTAPAAAPAQFFDEVAERTRLASLGYDDYTINATIESVKPITTAFGSQISELRNTINQLNTERQNAQRQQQTTQQQERQRRLIGQTARQQLMTWYPNELNDSTPPEVWNQIEAYARNSGMLDMMGFSVGAFTTAYARMRDTGMVTIPDQTRAPSAAVEAVAAADANARAIAAAAASGVAAAQAPARGAAQTPAATPTRVELKVPRYRKDPRTGKNIPLTPTETAAWIRDHTPKRATA